MLGLEAQVALDVHDDAAGAVPLQPPQPHDVLVDQVELLSGVCGSCQKAVQNGYLLRRGKKPTHVSMKHTAKSGLKWVLAVARKKAHTCAQVVGHAPLHPESTSIPMTCHMSTSALKYPHNDWLMYVLYHDDVRLMGQIIDSGCASLKATYPQPRLGALIDSFRVDPRECVNVVRVKMLIMFELVRGCFWIAFRGFCSLTLTHPTPTGRVHPRQHLQLQARARHGEEAGVPRQGLELLPGAARRALPAVGVRRAPVAG